MVLLNLLRSLPLLKCLHDASFPMLYLDCAVNHILADKIGKDHQTTEKYMVKIFDSTNLRNANGTSWPSFLATDTLFYCASHRCGFFVCVFSFVFVFTNWRQGPVLAKRFTHFIETLALLQWSVIELTVSLRYVCIWLTMICANDSWGIVKWKY